MASHDGVKIHFLFPMSKKLCELYDVDYGSNRMPQRHEIMKELKPTDFSNGLGLKRGGLVMWYLG
jgi:hypothetical protein